MIGKWTSSLAETNVCFQREGSCLIVFGGNCRDISHFSLLQLEWRNGFGTIDPAYSSYNADLLLHEWRATTQVCTYMQGDIGWAVDVSSVSPEPGKLTILVICTGLSCRNVCPSICTESQHSQGALVCPFLLLMCGNHRWRHDAHVLHKGFLFILAVTSAQDPVIQWAKETL